jgi:L-fucose isomerase-like protein
MPIVDPRKHVLFLPVIRGMYPVELTQKIKRACRECCVALGIPAIFPADDQYTNGVLRSDDDIVNYYGAWKDKIHEIKGLVIISGDFMRERVVQDTVRLLPEDLPIFLIVNNDNPVEMAQEKKTVGDSFCGSLSVHHNLRMLGRRMTRSCRINMNDAPTLKRFLSDYNAIMSGVECLRNMRIGMIGVNPNEFATTFTNQMKVFELGFSIHTYELCTLWADTVLAKHSKESDKYTGEFGEVKFFRPIKSDDPRVAEVRREMARLFQSLPPTDEKADRMARAFLWIKDNFEQDRIDTGTIHCWSEYGRFIGGAPCSVSVLCNQLLQKPVVCEGDICHSIMAKLAWAMTGEAGVILDFNNNGWDPRVFNVFHCSQTPTNWIKGDATVGDYGSVSGRIAPVPFTAIAAGTSSSDFHATVFQGRFINEDPGLRGTSGWAYVPNLPEVLRAVEDFGIHHFVAMKGHLADNVIEALNWRGVNVIDAAEPVEHLIEIERELPRLTPQAVSSCPVFSM